MLWWLLAGAGVLVLVASTLLYNRLVKLRNRVDNAWSQVDVQLRRRYDLIPNLVATVKAYAAHESETLEAVVRARDGARSAATIEEQGKAESALTGPSGTSWPSPKRIPSCAPRRGSQTCRRSSPRRRTRSLSPATSTTTPPSTTTTPLPRSPRTSSPASRASPRATTSRPKRDPGTPRIWNGKNLDAAGDTGARLRGAHDGSVRRPGRCSGQALLVAEAEVVAYVEPDGSVVVTEKITYDFIGSFEGGYREIPLKEGMSVDEVFVSVDGQAYAPGASAELGSSGAPGTYGTADLGDAYRIVWHYRASYEERTFDVRYRLKGLAVAHDDVVDVYWQVWGGEWQEPLGSLEATMVLPGGAGKGDVKVFGHPASVSGKTSLGPTESLPGSSPATCHRASSSRCGSSSRGSCFPRRAGPG